MSPPEPPLPPPVYLPRSYQWKRPAKPPQTAAPAAGPPQPAAPAAGPPQPTAPAAGPPTTAAPTAEPTQPAAAPRAATPPLSRSTTRSSAKHKLAPRSEPRSPATPKRTPGNPQSGQPLRRSARLNPRVCAVESRPQPAASQLLRYGQCLGPREGPYSFCSLVLEDLHTGHKEYLGDIQQLVAALPRSLDPGSLLTLCLEPCGPHYGGSCPPMGSFRVPPMAITII